MVSLVLQLAFKKRMTLACVNSRVVGKTIQKLMTYEASVVCVEDLAARKPRLDA